ncbi:Tenascin-R [Frankliniella fusca]|uniref:Tenascin-R n=1 Tax=Frankliniella fusca TaxID=407009 RepID=A0AAE1HTV2_9NEOP|nr:Tenascin-R [Frankliniella fusca]
MASKRRHADSESAAESLGLPAAVEDESSKKLKSDKNGNGTAPDAVESAEKVDASWIKISELTNDTVKVDWSSAAAGSLFSVLLENSAKNESQSKEAIADESKKCTVEFTDLKPLTKYTLKITSTAKGESSSTVNTMTPPSLEMPEIEEVTFKSAHLTLAPLPEDQAKDVEGYLLLVRPLEDAKDYPAAEIKDTNIKSKLESLVQAPFYIAYEFTQEELSEENGGQVQVGSGAAKKDGKYGAVQDPKLTSGGNYRVVLVVIMNIDGEKQLFAEESCQMLVK